MSPSTTSERTRDVPAWAFWTVFLWCVFALWLVVTVWPHDHSAAARCENYHNYEQGTGDHSGDPIAPANDCVSPSSANETNKANYEENPWPNAWIAFGTWVLVGGTILLGFFTYRLWTETRTALGAAEGVADRQAAEFNKTLTETIAANQIAREHMVASHRPWLKVNCVLKSGLVWDGKKIPVSFDFRIDNVGQAPAMNISLSPQIELFDVIGKKQEEAAEGWRNAPIKHGYMLFPGEFLEQAFAMEITEEMLVKLRAKNAEMNIAGPEDPVWPVLWGCVSYRSPLGSKRHITAFSYRFGEITNNDPSLLPRGFTPRGANIPQGKVAFIRNLEGSWAD